MCSNLSLLGFHSFPYQYFNAFSSTACLLSGCHSLEIFVEIILQKLHDKPERLVLLSLFIEKETEPWGAEGIFQKWWIWAHGVSHFFSEALGFFTLQPFFQLGVLDILKPLEKLFLMIFFPDYVSHVWLLNIGQRLNKIHEV